MTAITSFQRENRFLSNFWPCHINWKGLVYPTVEHAYVSSKVENNDVKLMIQACPTPGNAKEYLAAHNMKPGSFWTREMKLQVMEELLFIKFGGKEPLLTRALISRYYVACIANHLFRLGKNISARSMARLIPTRCAKK